MSRSVITPFAHILLLIHIRVLKLNEKQAQISTLQAAKDALDQTVKDHEANVRPSHTHNIPSGRLSNRRFLHL